MDVFSFLSFFGGLGGKGCHDLGQGPWGILLYRQRWLVSTLSQAMKAEDLL